VDETQRRKALNEDLFRKVNEQIHGLNTAFNELAGIDFSVICECDRLDCDLRLAVSPEAYRGVREDARLFLVAPGHQDGAVEDVIEEADDYWVVKKHEGEPAEIARALE
jgi:hypothetical protein